MSTEPTCWVAWEMTPHEGTGWVGRPVIPHAAAAGATEQECISNYRFNKGLDSESPLPQHVRVAPINQPPRSYLR